MQEAHLSKHAKGRTRASWWHLDGIMACWGAVQIPHWGRWHAMGAVGAQGAKLLLQICHIVGARSLGTGGASSVVLGTVHALHCLALLSLLLSVPER